MDTQTDYQRERIMADHDARLQETYWGGEPEPDDQEEDTDMTTDTDIHSCSFDCLRPECVRRAREKLFYAESLLREWQKFAADLRAADCAGQEWLDELTARTDEVLK